MLLRRFLPLGFFLSLFARTVFGPSTAPPKAQLGPGVVVEKAESGFAGANAGIQEGDVILRQSRGEAASEIESPFALTLVEIEQSPRGSVRLHGVRGMESQAWTLGPERWGLQTRPNFQDDLLALYLEGSNLSHAGKLLEAAQHWQAAAAHVDPTTPIWIRPWLLFRAAETFSEGRQWKNADEVYLQALEASASADPALRGQLLRAWAKSYQQRSDWLNAEKYFQQAVAENQKLDPASLVVAAILDDLAAVAKRRNDLVKAQAYFQQSLEIRQNLAPGSLPVAASLYNLGILAYERGDLTKVEESYQKALSIREGLAPGSLDLASSVNGLGNLAYARGDLYKARNYYKQALDLRQKLIPGSLDVAASFNNLGLMEGSLGELAKAEEYHQQALAIKLKLAPESLSIAITFNNLGLVADALGNLTKAEDYHRQALGIRQRLAPGSLDLAASLNNLGAVAIDRGDLAKAEEYLHQALDIKQKLVPASLDVAKTLNNLGNVAMARADLVNAEKYHRKALEIKQKLAPGSLDVAISLQNLGNVAYEWGDLAKAENYHWQALEITERLAPGGLDLATIFINLGRDARDRGDLAQAEEYYRQTREIEQKLAPESRNAALALQGLAELAQKRHDPAKAEEYYHQALAIQSKLAPESNEYKDSLASLADLVRSKGETDSALQLYEQALNAFEGQTAHLGGTEETRSNFRAKHAGYYRDYVDLLLAQDRPDRAFEVLEHFRARTLLEMLSAAHVNIQRGVDRNLLERERSLQADITGKSNYRIRLMGQNHTEEQIDALDKEIAEFLSQYQEIEAQIRAGSPSYAALTQPQPLTAKQVQKHLLDRDTLLLEYLLGPERSHLFLLSATTLTSYELPRRAEIEEQARFIHTLLTARNRMIPGEAANQRQARLKLAQSQCAKAAAALGRMLLSPVAREISGKRLLIVTDGALAYIPFAMLPSPENSQHSVPLAVNHEIVNLPSASVLAALRQQQLGRPPAPKAVAVLADPVFGQDDVRVDINGVEATRSAAGPHNRQDLSDESLSRATDLLVRSAGDVGINSRGGLHLHRLPFSRLEANAIAAVVPVDQAMQALDFRASRATATSPDLAQYRIVHFATHGLLDSRHPELSGLVLSLVDKNGKPQNGFLELQDIYNLNLSADLVVLSACETALGKEVDGEGLVGLTRGFMYAGATRVVASLWKVSDVGTANLMGRFYKAMKEKGLPPSAALRAAQIEMWRQQRWSDPYYWAAFEIQGEWK